MKSFFRMPNKKEKYILIGGDVFAIAVSLLLCFFAQIAARGRLDYFFAPITKLAIFPRINYDRKSSTNFCWLFRFIRVGICNGSCIAGLYEFELIFDRKPTLARFYFGVLAGVSCMYVISCMLLRTFSTWRYGECI